MRVYSDTTQKYYEVEDAVHYKNVVQSAWMMTHPDCELLDIFVESDGKFVFVFSKEQHKRWIKEWIKRSNENENEN